MDLLTLRPYLIAIVLISLGVWYFNRDWMPLSVVASVLLGLASLAVLVVVLPPMGIFLLFGLGAGCLLAVVITLCRRFARP